MIGEWEKMITIEKNTSSETRKLADIEVRRDTIKLELESSEEMLLNTSRNFIISRRSFDEKGNGARTKVLDEAIFSHNELLRKMTTRSFE